MTGIADMAGKKSSIRRTALILLAVALLIYITFILAAVLRS